MERRRGAGNQTIPGPVSLALAHISPGVQPTNATGRTDCAQPPGMSYIDVPLGPDNALAPGESGRVNLNFTDPPNTSSRYTPRALAGPAGR